MKKGISLIELLLAISIGSVVILLATTVFSDVSKDFTRSQRFGVLIGTAPTVRKMLSNYFERALGVAFTQGAPSLPPDYTIYREGGIFMVSDMRRCPEFDPGTSSVAANQSEVFVMCCSPKLTLSLAGPTPPLAAATVRSATSACKTTAGLSVTETKGGATVYSQCFQDIQTLVAFPVAQHQLRQTPIHQIDFFGNTGITKKGELLPRFNFRFSLYEAAGNQGPLTVRCQ